MSAQMSMKVSFGFVNMCFVAKPEREKWIHGAGENPNTDQGGIAYSKTIYLIAWPFSPY